MNKFLGAVARAGVIKQVGKSASAVTNQKEKMSTAPTFELDFDEFGTRTI